MCRRPQLERRSALRQAHAVVFWPFGGLARARALLASARAALRDGDGPGARAAAEALCADAAAVALEGLGYMQRYDRTLLIGTVITAYAARCTRYAFASPVWAAHSTHAHASRDRGVGTWHGSRCCARWTAAARAPCDPPRAASWPSLGWPRSRLASLSRARRRRRTWRAIHICISRAGVPFDICEYARGFPVWAPHSTHANAQ